MAPVTRKSVDSPLNQVATQPSNNRGKGPNKAELTSENGTLREQLNTQIKENKGLKKTNKAFQARIDELEEQLAASYKRNGMTKKACGKQLLAKVCTL